MATVILVQDSFDKTNFSGVHNIVMHSLLQENLKNTEDFPYALLSNSGVHKNLQLWSL